jgi:hypothetical protein
MEWIMLALFFLVINIIFLRLHKISTEVFWMLNFEMVFILGVVWLSEPWVA